MRRVSRFKRYIVGLLLISIFFGLSPRQIAAKSENLKSQELEHEYGKQSVQNNTNDDLVMGSCSREYASKYLASTDFKNAATSKKAFYKQLKNNLMKRTKNFTINYKGDYRDVYEEDPGVIIENIRTLDDKTTSDDADFLAGSITYIYYNVDYIGEKATFKFTIHYTESYKQVKSLNKEIKKVLKSLQVSKLSQVGKVKAIHDYIVNLVEYDVSLNKPDHSAYGGLVSSKHRTVCQGYALLVYKMLTEAGVPAHYVTGYAGEDHAWNVVKIDGKWYYLDATWNDPVSDQPILSHEYFLVGSKKMKEEHTLDQPYEKLYPVGEKDYDWKKALEKSENDNDEKVNQDQSKEEQEIVEDAMKRSEFIAELNKILDVRLRYSAASDAQKCIFDLYKQLYGYIVRELPDDKFELLYTGNEEFCDQFVTVCENKINQYFIDPLSTYVDSEQYYNDVEQLLLVDYSYEDIDMMTYDEFVNIASPYTYEAINSKVNTLLNSSMNTMINECLSELSY